MNKYFFLGLIILVSYFYYTTACGDTFHAHCQQNVKLSFFLFFFIKFKYFLNKWTFVNADCGKILNILVSQFQNCCACSTIGPTYRNYTLESVDKTNLVVIGHITFTDGYVDKQTIQLSQSGANCLGVVIFYLFIFFFNLIEY